MKMKPRALTLTSALALSLSAAPPPETSPEDLADFERKVAPRVIPPSNQDTVLQRAAALTEPADGRLTSFLQKIGQSPILIQAKHPSSSPNQAADPMAELFTPNPARIVINASNGVYFDAKNHELIYLGKVNVVGHGVTLTCDQDVKVIFTGPKENPAQEEKGEKLIGGMGDLKLITANGNIRLAGKKDGKDFYFGGDRALYDLEAGSIIIRGDQIGFRMGPNGQISRDKNASAVVTLVDHVVTGIRFEKSWETRLVPQDPQ